MRLSEEENACMIFDDTIIEKPSMDENEIICWHYDNKEGKAIKGINLMSAFYSSEKESQTLRVSIGYRIIAKP